MGVDCIDEIRIIDKGSLQCVYGCGDGDSGSATVSMTIINILLTINVLKKI